MHCTPLKSNKCTAQHLHRKLCVELMDRSSLIEIPLSLSLHSLICPLPHNFAAEIPKAMNYSQLLSALHWWYFVHNTFSRPVVIISFCSSLHVVEVITLQHNALQTADGPPHFLAYLISSDISDKYQVSIATVKY